MTAPPRRRRWPWVIGAFVLLGLLAAWWIDRQLEPHRLTARVLAYAGEALDLELSIDGDPEYALRPEPRLMLPNLVARRPGSTTPLLTATRVEVSLPWETLFGSESVVVTRVQLDAPVLDARELQAWLASRPASDEPLRLPTLTEGLAIRDGEVRGDGWSLSRLMLQLPRLIPGEPAALDVRARVVSGESTHDVSLQLQADRASAETPALLKADVVAVDVENATPWTLELRGALSLTDDARWLRGSTITVTGHQPALATGTLWTLRGEGDLGHDDSGWHAEPLALVLQSGPALPDLSARGALHWRDGTRVTLDGTLTRWPADWPALPEPVVSAEAPIVFELDYTGGSGLDAPLLLKASRPDGTTLDVTAVPSELSAWLDADTTSPLPPLRGTFETPRLQVGGVTLEGLRVHTLDDDAADANDAAEPATE